MKTRLIAGLLLMVAAAGSGQAPQNQVQLLVPKFQGPGELGRNVATVLNLQIWQTLRKAPSPNPSGLSFGDGVVVWDDAPLEGASHGAAEERALAGESQLVLWGEALPYGSGVVARAFLSIPRNAGGLARHLSLMTADFDLGEKRFNLAVDLPGRRYEFAPIVLTREIVTEYTSPASLKLYNQPRGGTVLGECGDYFTALQQNGDSVRVKAGPLTGWLHIPRLSAQRSEVVDFLSGIIRIFRGDWAGAQTMFERVTKNPHSPNLVKVDAYLYRALAMMGSGLNPDQMLRGARELNEFSKTTAQYSLLIHARALSLCLQRACGQAPSMIARLEAEERASAFLFADSDQFIETLQRLIAALRPPREGRARPSLSVAGGEPLGSP